MKNENWQRTSGWYEQPYTGSAWKVGDVLAEHVIKSQSSVSTPGYRNMRRSSLPMHPYSKTDTRFIVSPGTLTLIHNNYNPPRVYSYWGCFSSLGLNGRLNADMAAADPYALCVNKALQELSLSKGHVSVSIAEAGKTAEHIARTATRIFTAFRGLRRGRISEFTNALGISVSVKKQRVLRRRMAQSHKSEGNLQNFASSTWLEYSYGWKPLLSDVYTQAENLAEYMTEKALDPIRTVRASAKTEKVSSYVTQYSYGNWKVRTDTYDRKRGQIVINYKLAEQPSAANVFGITNPLLVAWELVPFSFVVDWFLPVGNMLENLTATNGLIFHSGTYSIRTEAGITCTMLPGITAGGVSCGEASGKSVDSGTAKSRTVLSTFPSVTLPRFKDPRSFSHAASAIALLQSIFLSKRG